MSGGKRDLAETLQHASWWHQGIFVGQRGGFIAQTSCITAQVLSQCHEHAAEIFRRARRAGVTSATVDVLIVAVAAANRRPLLTADSTQRRVAALAGVVLA